MATIWEEGSKALDAAADLIDLLRLAHQATQRLIREVHANDFEGAESISRKLHELRKEADRLNDDVLKRVRGLEPLPHRVLRGERWVR